MDDAEQRRYRRRNIVVRSCDSSIVALFSQNSCDTRSSVAGEMAYRPGWSDYCRYVYLYLYLRRVSSHCVTNGAECKKRQSRLKTQCQKADLRYARQRAIALAHADSRNRPLFATPDLQGRTSERPLVLQAVSEKEEN